MEDHQINRNSEPTPKSQPQPHLPQYVKQQLSKGVYNKKQQQKSMSLFNDTNNSINEILEILKHYRTEGRTKDSCSNEQEQPHQDQSSSFNISNSCRHRESSEVKLRLHSSLENISKHRRAPSTIRSKEGSHANANDGQGNIFSRLYEEDKALRERREKLFLNGRKRNQDKEVKQCTFSPNLKFKTEKCINQTVIESFYQKNIDWQNKVDKEIKIKQCQKINEGINQLTFAPKINAFKKRDKASKENNQALIEKKGVEQFLLRQNKAKNCIETLQARKKNAYGQIWGLKKCQFSYLH